MRGLLIATRLLIASSVGIWAILGCGPSDSEDDRTRIVFPGSRVGAEGQALQESLGRFMAANPDIVVEMRPTPDSADERHQLYVGWLNAREPHPDILQLDVIWVSEFAQAGWILALEPFDPDLTDFFPVVRDASRWGGQTYALPWFVDVGMLYWRTDLLDHAPQSFGELWRFASAGRKSANLPYGLVWPLARYEGLVTVYLEVLTAFGGRILDDDGQVVVDSDPGVQALQTMRAALAEDDLVPRDALAWTEERTRLAFQSGDSVLMRNWPYAFALMQDPATSKVAERFAVAPMPAGPGGRRSAALGGQQLAINARSEHPKAAYRVIEFLTRPEEMAARARTTGQYPPRRTLYESDELRDALAAPPHEVVRIIESAVARPSVPAYSEISEALQIHLHRALEGSEAPDEALSAAAAEMRRILARTRTAKR